MRVEHHLLLSLARVSGALERDVCEPHRADALRTMTRGVDIEMAVGISRP
jgi:hypothetical protein